MCQLLYICLLILMSAVNYLFFTYTANRSFSEFFWRISTDVSRHILSANSRFEKQLILNSLLILPSKTLKLQTPERIIEKTKIDPVIDKYS